MRKSKIVLFILIVLVINSCKKESLPVNEVSDIELINSFVMTKVSRQEYTQIDLSHFKMQKLKNGGLLYSFNFKDKKLKQLSAIKTPGSILLQINDYDIKSGSIRIKHRNLNTGVELIKEKFLSSSSNFQVVNFNTVGDPITLPPVVVYSYHHQNSSNFTTIIFNQIYQNNNPTNSNPYGTGLYETIGEGATGNTDGNSGPIIEGYLEFESIEEALEFFQWMNDINPAEAALVAMYPAEGLLVFRNSKTALTASQNWANNHSGSSNSSIDGRADAIRHAFWQALNTSDIGPALTILFANAHETSPAPPGIAPSLFALMTQMDTHNNFQGVNIANNQGWGLLTFNSTIWSYFENGYVNGNLIGLKYICKETTPYTLLYMYEACP